MQQFPQLPLRQLLFCPLALLMLGACGQQNQQAGSSSQEALRFAKTSLQDAETGEVYSERLSIVGGIRPYSVRLVRGALPPGLSVGGENISGTPPALKEGEKASEFSFTLEVSDGNLSNKVQDFKLKLLPTPPPALSWKPAPTKVSGEIRLPFELVAAKGVRSFRLAAPMPAKMTLVAVEAGQGRPVLLARLQDDILRIDGAFAEAPKSNKAFTVLTAVLKSEGEVQLTGTLGFELRIAGKLKGAVVTMVRPGGANTGSPATNPRNNTAPVATVPAATPAITPVPPVPPPTVPPAPPTELAPPTMPPAPITPPAPPADNRGN
jgi:hypothetical protein